MTVWLCDNPDCAEAWRSRAPKICPECGYPVMGYAQDPRRPAPSGRYDQKNLDAVLIVRPCCGRLVYATDATGPCGVCG